MKFNVKKKKRNDYSVDCLRRFFLDLVSASAIANEPVAVLFAGEVICVAEENVAGTYLVETSPSNVVGVF